MHWRVLWYNQIQPAPYPSSCLCQCVLWTGSVCPARRPRPQYDDRCCNPACPFLSPALALVLTSGSCVLTGVFLKFPYHTYSQQWISGVLAFGAAKTDMASPQPCHLLSILWPSLVGLYPFRLSPISATALPSLANLQTWLSSDSECWPVPHHSGLCKH